MMRKVWLWLILSSFLTAAADVPSEESDVLEANEEAKNLTDILNEFKEVEDNLKNAVYEDFIAAGQVKDDLMAAAKQKMQDGLDAAKEKLQEATKKFQELQEKAKERVEEERQKLVESYNEKMSQLKEQNEADKQKAKDAFKTLTEKMKAAIKQKQNEAAAQKKAVADYLSKVAAKVAENREAREKEKKERVEKRKSEMKDAMDEFKAKKAELDEQKAQLDGKYDEYEKKLDELKKTVQEAFKTNNREKYTEAVEDYLQEQLEKEFVDRSLVKVFKPESGASTILPAVKDSLIDTLAGKSNWETVSWVLLALCLLLAISLFTIIVYQATIAKKNCGYQKLDGNVESGNERTSLLGGPPKGNMVPPQAQTSTFHPSAPAGQAGEIQQF